MRSLTLVADALSLGATAADALLLGATAADAQ